MIAVPSPLAGKRILVTGGAGFVGRHVCERLEACAPAVVHVPRSRQYDLREPLAARLLLQRTSPDIVIHLAAVVGGIGANSAHPGQYFYDNAVMGLHLMEEARRAAVEKFVSVGSVCSYPKFAPIPFKENDLWNGYPEETNAPYGLAKKMLLVQAQAYRKQYGFNAITLIPVNLYGPGDNFDVASGHVISGLIRKAVEAREAGSECMSAWGTGNVSREFLYVADAAEGIVAAAELYNEGEPVNLGTGREIKIADLVETIRRLCRFEGGVRWEQALPDGQPRRCLDTLRAKTSFGWQSSTSLEDGLAETVEWYERHRVEQLAEVMANF